MVFPPVILGNRDPEGPVREQPQWEGQVYWTKPGKGWGFYPGGCSGLRDRPVLRTAAGAHLPVPFAAAIIISGAVLEQLHAPAGERGVAFADDIGLARRRGRRRRGRRVVHHLAL